jgi:hypothetical protein
MLASVTTIYRFFDEIGIRQGLDILDFHANAQERQSHISCVVARIVFGRACALGLFMLTHSVEQHGMKYCRGNTAKFLGQVLAYWQTRYFRGRGITAPCNSSKRITNKQWKLHLSLVVLSKRGKKKYQCGLCFCTSNLCLSQTAKIRHRWQ